MKLTRYEAQNAATLIEAIPFKTSTATLPGRTMAAIAIANATLQQTNTETQTIARDIATKLKTEDFDQRYAKRDKAIKEAFPEGTPFDPEKWNQICPDPEFEKIVADTDAEFKRATDEACTVPIDIPLHLSADHLADISALIITTDTVNLHDTPIPTPQFIRAIAPLFTAE